MHTNDHSLTERKDFQWLHPRIYLLYLLLPVRPYRSVTVKRGALGYIRPWHIGGKQGQYRVNLPPVEGGVRLPKQGHPRLKHGIGLPDLGRPRFAIVASPLGYHVG